MALVEMRGIVKRFGPAAAPVIANDGVDVSLARGEIVALVGENGAGKSTLMNILYGMMAPDAGEISLRGTAVRFRSPQDAIRAGLGMVHQHFMLLPSMTVADNVVYGAEPTGDGDSLGGRIRRALGMVDRRTARERVRELGRTYGLEMDPDARVADLPVGVRQRVELLKLLYRGAEVLIFDEPTAVLAPPERQGLFAVLRRLAEQQKAIVFITHKLDEVMALSHRALVMRDGRLVYEASTAETTAETLAEAMVGRHGDGGRHRDGRHHSRPTAQAEPASPTSPTSGARGPIVLEARDVHVDGAGAAAVRGVDVCLRGGEITAIAGVAGNGQEALVAALVGVRPLAAGRLTMAGTDVADASVDARRQLGMAYIPEDRHLAGMADNAAVRDNAIMGHHRRHSRLGLLRRRALDGVCTALLARFAVKLDHPRQPAQTLSGGNQQKLVVARELGQLDRDTPTLLIAEQPTRGVDIGASAAIHDALRAHRDAGHAVLLVSADLDEILSLADHIAVMFEGRIIGACARADAALSELGLLMAGQQP